MMYPFYTYSKLFAPSFNSWSQLPSMAFHLSEIAGNLCFCLISIIVIVIVIILLYVAGSIISFLIFFVKESIQKADKAPITGTVFHQLIYFDTLFDYQTDTARRHRTFRLIKPSHSDLFTTDPANVEHILKTNFSKYTKVCLFINFYLLDFYSNMKSLV